MVLLRLPCQEERPISLITPEADVSRARKWSEPLGGAGQQVEETVPEAWVAVRLHLGSTTNNSHNTHARQRMERPGKPASRLPHTLARTPDTPDTPIQNDSFRCGSDGIPVDRDLTPDRRISRVEPCTVSHVTWWDRYSFTPLSHLLGSGTSAI